MNICMIGTGYVGLVSGACFAQMGHTVTCVDVDADKIKALQSGRIPIYEPGLAEVVQKNVDAGRLFFTTSYAKAVPGAEAVFIGVGTPQGEDGHADLQYVFKAAEQVAAHIQEDGYTVVVDKSTVPVGTARTVRDIILKTRPETCFDVVSNPEFLREGAALEDFMKPDRIVVGVERKKAAEVMEKVYEPLTSAGYKLMVMDTASAELTKYASNAFLATKITFINEMAALCETVGADIRKVSDGMGVDARIGARFLQAGPGYGGSCFPKDTAALAKTARDAGCPTHLVETTIVTNQAVKERMAQKIIQACGGCVQGKTIGILGLAFKAGTDDMRDAPALTILPLLQKAGAILKAFDPEAALHAKKHIPEVVYCKGAKEALDGADCAVVLTEWPQFEALSPQEFITLLKTPCVIDLRNVYDPQTMINAGVDYTCIGYLPGKCVGRGAGSGSNYPAAA